MTAGRFDFAIVGGGPAGLAAAALLAAAGARVLLIDAARSRAFKAGEFVHPKVKAFINRLAILPQGWEARHLAIHGFVNTWASATPQETDFIFGPHGPAMALDRPLFETQLREAASNRGVEMRLGCTATNLEETGTNWRIDLEQRNNAASCTARHVLIATGRVPAPLQRSVKRRRFDWLAFVALRIQRPVANGRAFIEPFEKGWVFVTPLPKGAQAIYVFFDARQGIPFRRNLDSLREALRSCAVLRESLCELHDHQAADVEWFTGTAHSSLAHRTIGPNWCLLGDLAESRDPLSASGVFNALGDASRMAAHLLSGQLTAEASRQMDAERARSFAGYLTARRRHYAEETRWSGFPFWSGQGVLSAGQGQASAP